MTVDMIATGTDVKPLECLFFMRRVRSRTYFEQMKGRGVRVIYGHRPPGGRDPRRDRRRTRFVIVDAVGVTETELPETPPLDRKPTVPLDRLLQQVVLRHPRPGHRSRRSPPASSRLDRRLSETQRTQLTELAGGTTLKELARGIVDALDPDRQLEAARAATGRRRPDRRRDRRCVEGARSTRRWPRSRRIPSSASGSSRSAARTSRRSTRSRPTPCSRPATRPTRPTARARRSSLGSASCEEHRDEITALQLLYTRPYARG